MNIVKALKHLVPGAQWSCGETYDTLNWLDKNVAKPTEEALQAAHVESLAADALVAYKALRAATYPSIADQLDMLFHSMETGAFPKSDLFYATIAAVKDKFPKPV